MEYNINTLGKEMANLGAVVAEISERLTVVESDRTNKAKKTNGSGSPIDGHLLEIQKDIKSLATKDDIAKVESSVAKVEMNVKEDMKSLATKDIVDGIQKEIKEIRKLIAKQDEQILGIKDLIAKQDERLLAIEKLLAVHGERLSNMPTKFEAIIYAGVALGIGLGGVLIFWQYFALPVIQLLGN